MRILIFTERGKDKQVNLLKSLGHTVDVVYDYDTIVEDYDVVVSLSESFVYNAFSHSTHKHIPFLAHIDMLPKWELFLEDEVDWGFLESIPIHTKIANVKKYDTILGYWFGADYKTLSTFSFVEDLQRLTGLSVEELKDDHNVGILYPGLTKEYGFNSFNTFKDGVVCVADFIPQSRIDHVILALAHFGFSGVLRLVGSGYLKKEYEELAKKKGIRLEFYKDSQREEAYDKSAVNVSLFDPITPLEASYFGTPSISYFTDYMLELYDDTISYSDNNIVFCLADSIEEALNYSDNTRAKKSEYMIDSCTNNRIKIKDFNGNALNFENALQYTVNSFMR